MKNINLLTKIHALSIDKPRKRISSKITNMTGENLFNTFDKRRTKRK